MVETFFPNLIAEGYTRTSDATVNYNCIAWAAGDTSNFWWPDPGDQYYWPPSVTRTETIQSFVELFEDLGFELSENGGLEVDYEKIALYTLYSIPQHAARQLENGRWTSKLGRLIDIEHTLLGLEGNLYGQATQFFRRRK